MLRHLDRATDLTFPKPSCDEKERRRTRWRSFSVLGSQSSREASRRKREPLPELSVGLPSPSSKQPAWSRHVRPAGRSLSRHSRLRHRHRLHHLYFDLVSAQRAFDGLAHRPTVAGACPRHAAEFSPPAHAEDAHDRARGSPPTAASVRALAIWSLQSVTARRTPAARSRRHAFAAPPALRGIDRSAPRSAR
jgi:hypothetical protein